MVPLLSVVFVLLGAIPAYVLYLSRPALVPALLDRNRWLEGLRRFFWNRWGIDGAYTRVFVDGTLRVAHIVASSLETRLDALVHRALPQAFTAGAQQLVHRLRADTEELVYNVSYVLVLFVMLLAYLFLGTDGS